MATFITPISKIQLPNGDIVNLANITNIVLPDDSRADVTWNINNFTGNTTLISGSDYLAELSNYESEFHDIADIFDRTTQTKNGTTLSWESANNRYKVNTNPSANTSFIIYENASGFPTGVNPGDIIVFGAGSGNSNVVMYTYYTTDGTNWTSLASSYSATSRGYAEIPANAIGIRITIYAKTTSFSNVYVYPIFLAQNS